MISGWFVLGLLLGLQLAEALTGTSCPQRFRLQPRLASQPPREPLPVASLSAPPSAPLATVQREDNAFEKIALFGLTAALASLSRNPLAALKRAGPSYASFVEVSQRHFMAGRSPLELKQILTTLLDRVIPPPVKAFFRSKFAEDKRWISEQSVLWFSFNLLSWLVGESEGKASELDGRTYNNIVELKECRYLAEAGCKKACVQLCKGPTQAFFKESLGIPLYMKPNFETCACELQFGVEPPPPSEDPAYAEMCFTSCEIGTAGKCCTAVL